MAREIELKLALPESARSALLRHPLLARALAKTPARRLLNIYFDTPVQDLRRRGIALRLRRQGRQWLQTVKCAGETAGGLSSRPEWEQPYDGQAFDFSAVDAPEVRKFLEKMRDRGRLGPVFESDFQRRTWHFEPEPGSRIVLAYDAGEVRAGGRSLPISELELEIEQGGTGPLLALALELAARLPLRPDSRSKAERGFGLNAGTPPVPRHFLMPVLSSGENPRAAFSKIALACLVQIQGNEDGVLGSDDPEFIHQMRVGLRRLRSALKSFLPVLPPDVSGRFEEPLRELARKLGGARDRDVLVEEVIRPVAAAFPGDPRLEALTVLADGERRAARQAARSAVADPAYGRLFLALLTTLHDPGIVQGEGGLEDFADKGLQAAQKRLSRRAERAASLDVAALHALRISAKHLRYLLGFLAGLYPTSRTKQELARLTALQNDLGRINDLANARRLLLPHAGAQEQIGEALALVEGWQRGHLEPLFAALPARLAALAKPARRKKPVTRER